MSRDESSGIQPFRSVPRASAALYDDVNRVIAALHDVDPYSVGLGNYGRPGHYLERQIARWSRQYKASETKPIDAMDRLFAWLPQRLPPESAARIVHGDLRLDNMIFHPTEPRMMALIDWELSTLGDPLADLAYHMLTWVVWPDEFRGMAGANLAALGIPDAESYIARYAERRGVAPIEPALMNYNIIFSLFRLAAILQGIAKRAEDGNASAVNAEATGSKAATIADLAWSKVSE
jgi:aminoglycoside phosphotransferase (APT) family kinase protein